MASTPRPELSERAGGIAQTAVRGTSVTLLGQALRFGLQLVSLKILTTLLSPADFGLVAMAVSIVAVADILRDFGLSSAAIQAKVLTIPERTNLFWANTGLGVVAAALVLLSAPLIVLLYHEPRLAPVVVALSGVFVMNGIATQWRADLSRELRFSALALSEIGAQVVALIAAIAAALAGAGYWAIVVQLNVVAAVTLVLSGFQSGFIPGLPRRDVSIRPFLRYGGGVLGTQLIAYGTRNIDNVAIGARWGATELGFYGRAYQVLMMPLNQINAPLTRIALPILSRHRGDPVAYARYLHRSQLVGCYVTSPALALIAGLAVPIVAVLFGPGWGPVAPMLTALAVGGTFRAVAQIAYWIFLAEGLTREQFRMYVITRPVVILVMLAGLPWGGLGVAITGSIAYMVDWLVQMWWVSRVSDVAVKPLLRTQLGALAGVSLPVGLASWALTLAGLPALATLVLGCLSALGAAALAALLLPWVRADVRVMTELFRVGLARRGKVV